jgi:hypothetical protein
LNVVSDGDLRREPLAAHVHGVQTDVEQHLEPTGRADRDRMVRRVELGYDTVAGSEQPVTERINRDTLADHVLGKDRVRDLLDRDDQSGDRRHQSEVGHRTSGGVGAHSCSSRMVRLRRDTP